MPCSRDEAFRGCKALPAGKESFLSVTELVGGILTAQASRRASPLEPLGPRGGSHGASLLDTERRGHSI